MAFDRLLERETRMVVAMGVETDGTTEVNAINIPADFEVHNVWARSSKAGTGAANISIGDEDDPDGWVLAQDHVVAIGTVIGKVTAHGGVFARTQIASTPPVDEVVAPKLYTAENNIIIVLSSSGTIQSKWDVFASMTPVPDSIT